MASHTMKLAAIAVAPRATTAFGCRYQPVRPLVAAYHSRHQEPFSTQKDLQFGTATSAQLIIGWKPKQLYSRKSEGNKEEEKKNVGSSLYQRYFTRNRFILLGVLTGASGSALLLLLLRKRFSDFVDYFETDGNKARYVYPFDPGEVEFFFKKHCLYWLPRRFSTSPIAWEYLQELGRGGTNRETAIAKVSHMEGLSESECVTFAMSMDLDAATAIAHNGGDPRLFPPPPACVGPKEGFKAYYGGTFRNIVDPLPEENIHYNLNFIFRTALETYLPSEQEELNRALDLYTGFDEAPILEPVLPEISEVRFLKICLQVVISHTRDPSQIKLIPKAELLEVLVVIAGKYKTNNEILSLVLKVLANLSCDEGYAEDIRSTGCLHILAEASRSNDIKLILPAKRALHNLDREGSRHNIPSGLYQLYPDVRADESVLEYDIIFVHGILGGAFRTWRQQDKIATLEDKPQNPDGPPNPKENAPTWVGDKNGLASKIIFKMPDESKNHQSRIELEDGTVIYSADDVDLEVEDIECQSTQCWPRDWLPMDCPNARIMAVDFDSFVTHWSGYCPVETTKRSLQDRADELLQKLHAAGIGERPIIWITHSMGGLLAKSLLTQAAVTKEYEDICKNTKGIVFCSVPHVGSYIALANSSRRFIFMPTEEALELTNNDKSLTLLHERFQRIWRAYKFKILSFGEMLETTSVFKIAFKMVPFSSADPGMGDFYKVKLNHLNTCKPNSRGSFIYQKIVGLIHKITDELENEKKK